MWQATKENIWQGRDDSRESPIAKRVFQTITQMPTFQPEQTSNRVALLGFASDEGVIRNLGRKGAAEAPPVLRQALANLASQDCHYPLIDCGDIGYKNGDLESGQSEFANAVTAIQQNKGCTLVLGGGHETAFAHGSGLYQAYLEKNIAIINFDPHLDVRRHHQASSGTPFLQLAEFAKSQSRLFNYTCVGASKANNTAALFQDANALNVQMLWDNEVNWHFADSVADAIKQTVSKADYIYLTIDLDVLPSYQMPSVSAPAALGISLDLLMHLTTPIMQSGKVVGADLVEYNPKFDINSQGARVAARLAWHLWQHWQ